MRYLTILALVFLFHSCSHDRATKKTPRNIILFISDGWGYNHIAATNYFHGIDSATYEKFPVHFPMSTYPASTFTIDDTTHLKGIEKTGYDTYKAWHEKDYIMHGYTGSAPSVTAIATGYKSAKNAIGVDMHGNSLKTIAEHAIKLGKSAGVITTVPFSHATPAGFGTHNVNRYNYAEIAREFILDSKFRVLMGCGHPYYNDNAEKSNTALSFKYVGDSLMWYGLVNGDTVFNTEDKNKSIVQDITGDGRADAWTFITDSLDFASLMHDADPPIRLAGVAKAHSTLQEKRGIIAVGEEYKSDNPIKRMQADAFEIPFNKKLPCLYQMSIGALNVLNRDEEGFFIMIEGGAVDWAGHDTNLGRIIEEMTDFNRAVDSVVAWVEQHGGWEENLVIVTGDHETGYLVGPDFPEKDTVWQNDILIKTYPIKDNGAGNMPGAKFLSASHTNQLIPLYAKGAGSKLFEKYATNEDIARGKYIDNTNIAHLMFTLWSEK